MVFLEIQAIACAVNLCKEQTAVLKTLYFFPNWPMYIHRGLRFSPEGLRFSPGGLRFSQRSLPISPVGLRFSPLELYLGLRFWVFVLETPSKFHRSAQDRTPPMINDKINVWTWACTIMWMVDKSFWPLTSPLLWRLSQQSKKYFANLSLASGLPFILILSLTSIKCGELQNTQAKNKNGRWSVPLQVGSLWRSKTL